MHVLDSLLRLVRIVEEKDGEDGGEARRQQLDVGGLGQAEQVKEVTSTEKAELIEEAGLDGVLVRSTLVDLIQAVEDLVTIISQCALFILLNEHVDLLLVFLLNFFFVKEVVRSAISL